MKRKHMSRLFSALLTLTMLFCLLPGSAFAAEQSDKGILPEIAGENGTTYQGLFTPTILKEQYTHYWEDYCAVVVGADSAKAMAEMQKFSVSGDKVGADAIQANEELMKNGMMQFCCELTQDADTIHMEGDQITVKNAKGEIISDAAYAYAGEFTVGEAQMSFTGDLYKSCDAATPAEFTYFLFRDDTPAATYHIEFRYGSDLESLKGYITGKYAYWLAAGIPTDADERMIENCIALFCLENMDYSEARTNSSIEQLNDLVGQWDYYANGTVIDSLRFAVDSEGHGVTNYNGQISGKYQVYAYDNDGSDSTKSGIYLAYSEEPNDAKYSITEKDGKSYLTLTGKEDGQPYAITYVKNSNYTDVTDTDWSKGSIAYATTAGLFHGVGNNEFAPHISMSRSMLMTVIARMDGQTAETLEKGMEWAVANKISDGSNGDDVVTREQSVTMLYRYARMKGYDTTHSADLDAYADGEDVHSYAVNAMTWATEHSILKGMTADTLVPQGFCTREQGAALLTRFSADFIPVPAA